MFIELHDFLEQVDGSVTFNGHNMDEFVPQRTSAYISQHDMHIGDMTVRETLDFSARFQGVGSRYGITLNSNALLTFLELLFQYKQITHGFSSMIDVLTELSRREKEEGIKPDPDIDIFMKVSEAF